MTSNMIYIVVLGVGLKCPRKIHLNTQCPPPLKSADVLYGRPPSPPPSPFLLIKIIALLHILLPLIKTFYQTNTTFLYPFEFQLKNEKVSFPAFNSRPF